MVETTLFDLEGSPASLAKLSDILSAMPDNDLARLHIAVSEERHRREVLAAAAGSDHDQVVGALELLGVPTATTILVLVARIRSGRPIDPRTVTSMRRDDQQAWGREVGLGRAHPRCLVPALHHTTLAPVRGQLAMSTWPLERRLVTPRSPRADLASAALALLEEAGRVRGVDAAASDGLLEVAVRLIAPLSKTRAEGNLPASLTAAATFQHQRWGGVAGRERQQAEAAALAGGLTEHELVWGRPGPGRPRRKTNGPATRSGEGQ